MIQHIAIIPDGNRHWARVHGLPNTAGYPQGIKVIERCCFWAIENNIPYISFYCFSTENLVKRPQEEVDNFIQMAMDYTKDGLDYYLNMNIQVCFNGRKDRLPSHIIQAIEEVEQATAHCTKLKLILCIDYGGRNEIVQAIAAGAKTEDEISDFMNRIAPDPDIIVRTNNIRRLSNFMLWQASYSELFFIEKYFPDLQLNDLDNVLIEYENRERYYGGS